jgi:6-phosphofructokinase 1
VINASLYGIIKETRKHKDIETLYGAVNGIEGILNENFVDLTMQPIENYMALKRRPGAFLGGCRYMIKSSDINDEDIKRVFDIFKKNNIRYFFYNGGNDSMDTADKIDKVAKALGYEIKVIGVPKTIDNDLAGTDHCPGYGSCAKYLITSVVEAGIHTESMYTSEPVTIMVTVGRNAGWLPAATSLAKREPEEAPHLICFPEIPFDEDKFIKDVERIYNTIGGVFIVTGEGLVNKEGNFINASYDAMALDAFGHPQLGGVADTLKQIIESRLKLKTRWIKPDICQQAAMHMASSLDIKEAEMCGAAAVKFAVKGKSGFMVTIDRIPGEKYKSKGGLTPLSSVANVDRFVPREFINEEGNFVTPEFIEYMKPLIMGEVKPDMRDGFPIYPKLR